MPKKKSKHATRACQLKTCRHNLHGVYAGKEKDSPSWQTVRIINYSRHFQF